MFSESSPVLCEGLTELNLEVFLDEQAFVDFFNTFLALPCFQQKLFYNKEAQLFEEFYEKLADDVGTGDARAASALRQFSHFKGTIYNVSSNKARMGYYVNQLDKDDGFNFIKNRRLQLFLRSELYAEYKLSRILAQGQECYLRDVFSDDDSGVELAVAVLQRRGRRPSAVNFKLDNDEDDDSCADEKEENDEKEGEFYLPGHYSTIEETFDAWRESFKKSENRTSTGGSYRSILTNSTRKTPEPKRTSNVIDDVETQSSSSCYSEQETETSYSRNSSERPGSGVSVISDKLNVDVGGTWCNSSHSSAKSTRESSEIIQDAETNSRDEEERVQPFNNIAGKQLNRTEDSDSKLRTIPRNGMDEKNEINERVTDVKEIDLEIPTNSPNTELARKSIFSDYINVAEKAAENDPSGITVDNAIDNISEANLDTSDYEISFLPTTEESLDYSNKVQSEQDMAENTDLDSSMAFNECDVAMSKNVSENVVFKALETVDEENSEEDKEVEQITNISSSPRTLDSRFLERNTSGNSEHKTHSRGSGVSSISTSPIRAEEDTCDATKDVLTVSVIQPDLEAKQLRGQELEKPFISLTTVDESTSDVGGSNILPNQQQPELALPEQEDEHKQDDLDGDSTDADQASFTTLQGIRGILGSRKRSSIAATSLGFDDQDSTISDDGWDEDSAPYDMTKKAAFDAFKEFLLGANGEKQFRFWLDSECAKHLQYEEEKALLIKNMQDKYLRCGGVFEFSLETKRRLMLEDATKLTFNNLFTTQDTILEPVVNYWCPRFTMHQQRHHTNPGLEYLKSMEQRPHSCVRRLNELSNLPQSVLHEGLNQLTPHRVRMRPHSSVVHDSGKSQPQTSKHHLRAKSAHPRLVHSITPVHTNASTLQLQLATAPMRKSYGFNEPKMAAFPSGPEPDYASSVRLFIQPVPSMDCKPQRILRRLQRTSYISSESQAPSTDVPEHSEKSALDSLIEGLIHERQTGQLLELFLVRQGNQLWLNCLTFWKSLQEYNAYFYADSLNPFALARKARYMYVNFIIAGSLFDLQLHEDIREQVRKELDPPYEELFDTVEEHVLFCLLEPWSMLQEEDENLYNEVNKEQKLRHIELKIVTRRKQSIMETAEHEMSDDDSDKERISLDEANRPLPVPKDGFTFETLIRNRTEVGLFKDFLSKKHIKGVKDLMAWTDMETFRRIPRYMEGKRDNKAKEVRTSWLTKKYFFGPESPATREGQNMVTTINGGREIKERPISPVIFESQKFVRARIERRWLMMFKQTAEFIERQKPRSNVQEIVEDVLLKRRLQRSEAAWKILNSRWVSSSRDVVALRQTLLNAATCAQFRTFVAIKGDTFENDIQFWLEVQRFKDLCHAHAQESLIRKKVQTIVECFLNSAITPELPIDIPMEMGDKLLDRLSGRSPSVHPYVFREAQTTVFRVLFNHWKDFVSYRSRIPEGQDQLLYLEEQLKKCRAETKAKKEASERRRLTRLSAERKKREKEEKDRKREDLTSLFSLDTASMFHYNDEDDVNSWYYSKHVVEQERQEHMARLREQGIDLPEETFYERSTANTDDAKSRRSKSSKSCNRTKVSEEKPTKLPVQEKRKGSEASTAEKPPNKLVSSLKHPTAGSSYRRGSMVSFRRSSSVSITQTPKEITSDKNNAILEEDHEELGEKEHKTVGGTTQGEKCQELVGKDIRKAQNKALKKEFVAEIQVIPEETELALSVSKISPLKMRQPSPAIDQVKDAGILKLLANRSQKTPRRLSSSKHETLKDKKGGVPLDAISCISDYSAISNIDYMPKKSHSKTVRAGKTPALTSKSLKDFTNSPEGAPLSMSLPLVRITSASHVDTSVEGESLAETHALFFKSRPHCMSHTHQGLSRLTGRTGRRRVDRESRNVKSAPDVIVN